MNGINKSEYIRWFGILDKIHFVYPMMSYQRKWKHFCIPHGFYCLRFKSKYFPEKK